MKSLLCNYGETMITTKKINLRSANDSELLRISAEGLLSLSRDEMRAIQRFFKSLERDPTDLEIETIAQTWSEHCFHKTFKSVLYWYDESSEDAGWVRIPSMFHMIREVTDTLSPDWCISLFKDNAGIIGFDEEYAIAFKAETHNHPSALEPYGGAGTGIGGVIRDILGAGLGAKPILTTDIFCCGLLDTPLEEISEHTMHPRRLYRGIVAGVRDYSNQMGVPTLNGTAFFDEGYLHNVLVFCGTVGLIPKDAVEKKVSPGDLIVTLGGRTGRDGLHGATFSSASLDKDVPSSVVQIGNPILEKKILDLLMKARDARLFSSITDCGAGGFSSAVGELAQDCGAKVFLDKVPLKYPNLAPWEIWLSESQERMVLSVPKDSFAALQTLCSEEDVELACIGEFVSSGKLEIFYGEEQVCDLDLDFLFHGVPFQELRAKSTVKKSSRSSISQNLHPEKILLSLLAHHNIASKEAIIRQYDYEVQGMTVGGPFAGIGAQGPSDAAIIRPRYDSDRGVVVSCGINPWYGMEDPYAMAGCCIEEAIRNCVAVGGDPERIAILDNFCWGDTRNENQLGALVRCVQGCRDYALAYKTPFISGKDSLNNTYDREDGETVSIPGTLLISAVSVIPDVYRTISSDFKESGNLLYILGMTKDEMAGSHFSRIVKSEGGIVPKPDPSVSFPLMKSLYRAIGEGLVQSCHDCSEGGFAVALSEMMIGGAFGAEVDLAKIPSDGCELFALLFGESQGRFIVEVKAESQDLFESLFQGFPCACVGKIIPDFRCKLSFGLQSICDIEGDKLDTAWRSTITW